MEATFSPPSFQDTLELGLFIQQNNEEKGFSNVGVYCILGAFDAARVDSGSG